MLLRVLAVADEPSPQLYDYLDPAKWSDVDFIISCGDLHPGYLDFLATRLGKPIFYVRGNHDGSYQADEYAVGQNLHARIINYRGIRIAGFEGCRRYNHGSPQYTEREMNSFIRRTRLATLRHGVPDMIVTHAPPEGIHDGSDPCHRGFSGFRKLMNVWKPAHFLHGHTHAYEHGDSITTVGNTTVTNVYPYHVFEIAVRSQEMLPAEVQSAPPRLQRAEHSHIGYLERFRVQ